METILTSTTGLIPMLLSLIGVLATLQYLKGMKDLSKAMRFVFWGFLFIFLAKLQVFAFGVMPQKIYYFCLLLFHLFSAIFLIAGSMSFKAVNVVSKNLIISACLLALVWSWYVVIITRDAGSLTLSLAFSTLGYAFLATSLWRRKTLKSSIGFVITGWLCVFLVLYNLLSLMSWGQSLLSPAFETFLYIAVMCGWILISNNLMAHQFDTLEQQAEESKARLRLMIQMSPFPIVISRLKDDQLMLINNKAGALFGLDVKHPGNFKTVDYFAEPAKRAELLAQLEKHPVVDDFEFLVKPRKGEPFWLLLSARVIDFEYEIALYMAFQNITDRKKKELRLFDQATKDPLTKCYNRRQFEELAKNEVQRSRRYGHSFCLLMIDADHFKKVNDTHGHAVGDIVLQALADCCRRTLRESDIVARFGGEEFVVLLPDATIENGIRVAERLRIKISKLVVKNEQDQDVQFTVSIGLVSSSMTDDITELLKMSDEALYAAKENGRNQVVIYDKNGPNKDFPKPEGGDITKAESEPLYYFKPPEKPILKNKTNDLPKTGFIKLSSPLAVSEPSLEEEKEEPKKKGISLNSLYNDMAEDTFTPSVKSDLPKTAENGEDETVIVQEEDVHVEDNEVLPLEEEEKPFDGENGEGETVIVQEEDVRVEDSEVLPLNEEEKPFDGENEEGETVIVQEEDVRVEDSEVLPLNEEEKSSEKENEIEENNSLLKKENSSHKIKIPLMRGMPKIPPMIKISKASGFVQVKVPKVLPQENVDPDSEKK